jgi:hypothetical protein
LISLTAKYAKGREPTRIRPCSRAGYGAVD